MPFAIDAARPVTGADASGGRVVRGHDDRWYLLAFRDIVDGHFVGVPNDPIAVADLDIPTAGT